MNKAQYSCIALVIVLFIALGIVSHLGPSNSTQTPRLTFYCAAGQKAAVEGIVAEYSREYGVQVNVMYGGSGSLLHNLSISNKGDLYLAADSSYIEMAEDKNMVRESMPIAIMKAGLAVSKGNPHGLHSLQDIIDNPDVRIGLANPATASIGKFTQEVLREAGYWNTIEQRVRRAGVFTGTVNELANTIKLGSLDVALVWDALAAQYSEVDFVSVPLFDALPKKATLAILRSSEQLFWARHFARYLSARDRGLLEFKQKGYFVVQGPKWFDVPEAPLRMKRVAQGMGEEMGAEIHTGVDAETQE